MTLIRKVYIIPIVQHSSLGGKSTKLYPNHSSALNGFEDTYILFGSIEIVTYMVAQGEI